MIEPHGGTLVDRCVRDKFERAELEQYSLSLKRLSISESAAADLELIANGAYSPLEGFMSQRDYRSVLESCRLAHGIVWTIPIVLAVTRDEARDLKLGSHLALARRDGRTLAILQLEEKFIRDRELEAELVYGTRDAAHPGVAALYQQGEVLLAGPISYLGEVRRRPLGELRLEPRETRRLFAERGWKSIVAFQTRNPIHRAHEYIQKCALELVDGLLLHPLVGETKADDIPAEVRVRCYQVLLEKYYPRGRVLLALFPAAMRYAGPREAIFHALVRKNYGATHFIVGRDHAGVGNFYGPYDSQRIFSRFKPEEIGITPLFFENTFYCRACGQMASEKTCAHENGARLILSGTRVREMLARGQMLPEEFTRPEVSRILASYYNSSSHALSNRKT